MVTRRIQVGAVTLAAIGLLAGCSSGGQAETEQPAVENGLAGCGPLSVPRIEKVSGVTNLRPVSSPTICSWVGVSAAGDGEIVDITYSWLKKNSLMFDRQTALQLGYQTENMVTKSFGGFYWRDPRDPGSCAVSAADSGTVTWWVHHRDHNPQPDPCPAAWQLIFETVKLDG